MGSLNNIMRKGLSENGDGEDEKMGDSKHAGQEQARQQHNTTHTKEVGKDWGPKQRPRKQETQIRRKGLKEKVQLHQAGVQVREASSRHWSPHHSWLSPLTLLHSCSHS